MNNDNIFGAQADNANPAPVETPAAAPAPAPTPAAAPAPAATPVATAPAATTPVAGAAPIAGTPKKKKGGLIAGIVAGALVLCGGGGAAAYFLINESTEKVVGDALLKTFSLDDYNVSITASVIPPESSGYTSLDDCYAYDTDCGISAASTDLKSISINANIAEDGYNYASDGSASIELTDGKSFNVGAAVKLVDKSLYFRVDDLSDVIKYVKEEADYDSLYGDDKELADSIIDLIKEVDDEWFEVDLSKYDSTSKAVDCLHQAQDDRNDKEFKNKVVEIYEEYPFVKFDKDKKLEKKDGLYQVDVSFDEELGEKFSDKISELDIFKNLEKCVEDAMESAEDDFGDMMNLTGASFDGDINFDFGKKSVEKKSADANLTAVNNADSEEQVVTLGIKPFSHTLETISYNYEEDGGTASFLAKISDGKNAISAPSGAKSIEDLKNSIESLIEKYSNYSSSNYGGYSYNDDDDDDFDYDSWCKEIYDDDEEGYKSCLEIWAD